MTLGLPLWEVLTPQERIALLGHELGHFTSGDTWHYYVQPTEDPNSLELVVNLLYFLPRWLIADVVSTWPTRGPPGVRDERLRRAVAREIVRDGYAYA